MAGLRCCCCCCWWCKGGGGGGGGPRTRVPVGAGALGFFFVLCWLYIFPAYRLPDEKEIVQGVRQQLAGAGGGSSSNAAPRNRSAAAAFR